MMNCTAARVRRLCLVRHPPNLGGDDWVADPIENRFAAHGAEQAGVADGKAGHECGSVGVYRALRIREQLLR